MIAFIFPGQGAQKVGMGKSLAERYPICRDTFAEADAALGESLSGLCFEGPEERLVLTENTQPAILTVSVAAHAVLAATGGPLGDRDDVRLLLAQDDVGLPAPRVVRRLVGRAPGALGHAQEPNQPARRAS